ncbi:hypothetical protein M378DRAFT_167692 [Amanita muscaria Koide BX008]|uniref:RRM Nup35-type domain-containing protein n=1 Tax=Amanita muscaria (strain Koide BX008) TaxID=946122 RepID=A0A0C2T304_AMAMK|nr:hypothetical protein M378DRAFT_167692 [Amanita muscaria Koide BX008]
MSASGSAHHHNPNLSGWGSTTVNPSGTLTSSLSDSLSQSRSQYQPGYLMSTQQGSPRAEDVPIIQTKAKMNQVLVRGKASEFGMDSMFESSRKRQTLTDDDAPPMTSVFDIPNESNVESSPSGFQPRGPALHGSSLFKSRRLSTSTANGSNVPQSSQQPNRPLYVIVFGYPPDRYSVTVEYFRALGDSTDPDLNNEIVNCFRLGYHDPGDAMRAVRKNGEILSGCFMVGVKWADPALAETLFGPVPLFRSTNILLDGPTSNPTSPIASAEPHAAQNSQQVSPTAGVNAPSFGTPIKLAPSAAAFRRSTAGGADKAPQQSQPGLSFARSWVPAVPGGMTGGNGSTGNVPAPSPWSAGGGGGGPAPADKAIQNRGMLGQVSDLIFGW